jgi:serine/threonine protein kinase
VGDHETLVNEPDTVAPAQVGDIRPGALLRETYRVLNHVSDGGVGVVFAAAHERLPGRVAVKALQGDRVLDAESLSRFRSEAEVTASLRHPNIVQILDFDVSPGGVPYLVMEFIDGADLRTVGARGPMAVDRVARVVRQIASALQAAHAAGVVHRDLKPENVMLVEIPGESDFVKVVDFGLSKLLHHRGPPVTKPDQILGTPGYMPPEQILGRPLDARADQFALASLAFELFAGRPAFLCIDSATWLKDIMQEEPPPLSALVPWPATALSAVLARGMAKAPSGRYPSVADFDKALRAAIEVDATMPAVHEPHDSPRASARDGDGDTARDRERDSVTVSQAGDGAHGDASGDTPELHEIGKSFRW